MNSNNFQRSTKQRPRRQLTLKFDDLPDNALVCIDVVMDVTGRRTTTIYSEIKNNRFPAPERWGSRCSRWRVSKVRQWLANPSNYIENTDKI
jgi:predicted DNA-binding transcriptional regulator AlpA